MKSFDRAKHIDHQTLQYSAHYWVTIKRYVHILWAIPWTIPIFTAAIFYCDTKKYNSKPHPPTALPRWDTISTKRIQGCRTYNWQPITSSWFSYRLTHALKMRKWTVRVVIGRRMNKRSQRSRKISSYFFNETNVEVVITHCLERMIGELSLEAVDRLCS